MAEVLPEEELIPLPNSAAPPAGVSGTGLSGAGLPGASPPGGEEAGVPTPGEVSAGEAFAFGDNPVATAELSAAGLPIVGAPPEESEVADFVEFVAEAEPLSPAAEDAAFSVLAGEEASPAEPPSGETDDDPFTVVRGVDAGGSSVDFGKPPGKSRASGAAASDEAEVRFVTDFDRERRETEQTSEERILPTIGVDENGDPISASDLEVEPDPGAKRGKKRRKAAPTAAVGPETLVRSGRGRGALWGLAGLLAGAGAFAGVWQAGWLAGDGQKPPPAGPVRPAPVAAAAQAPGVPTPAPVAAPSAADGWRALEVGDAATALAAFEQGDAADPAVLAGRGQARWLSYLQQQARQDKPLAADAEAVQAARGELEQAVARGGASPEAARAQLWLGLIEEVLGNPAKAQEIYRQGAQTYPQQQALFRAGLNRLQALAPAPAPAASWRPAEALLGFTLLAVFQEPGAAPPAPPEATAPGDESGFAFWEALVLARNHRYSEAREALRRARDVHEKQRLLRAGKGLNPLSDPLNQIFGRSCEEIDAAWAVCESLYRLPGAAETVRQKGFPAIAGDAVATLRQAADTLKQASPESRTLPEAIEALVRSRDALARDLEGRDAQLRAVQESLKEAGFDAPKVEDAVAKALAAQTDAADKLRQVRAGLAGAGVKSAEPGEAVAELAATVAAVADRLRTAGFVGEGAGRAVLLRGLDEAVARAKRPAAAEVLPPAQALMTGGAFSVAQAMRTGERLRQAQAEVRRLGALVRAERDRFRQRLEAQQARHEKILGQVRTPPEMLDVWLTILENPFRKEEAAAALTDAQRVLDDAQAAPDVRAKALAVKGLALRNRGEFDAARGALAQSQKHAAFAGDQTWGQVVQTAARGLRDPGLVLEAVGTAADGPGAKDRARDLLELGLKMFPAEKFPEEHGRLLARRATFRLAAG
ncbi:MAG TPA: hypothetical protein VIL46_08870, partial [Gemmataceae bacterium]